MTKRQSLLLYAFCAWTIWVWGTRIWNIWGDETRSGAFKAVHTVLALVSVTFAVAAWVVVRRVRAGVHPGGPPAASSEEQVERAI